MNPADLAMASHDPESLDTVEASLAFQAIEVLPLLLALMEVADGPLLISFPTAPPSSWSPGRAFRPAGR